MTLVGLIVACLVLGQGPRIDQFQLAAAWETMNGDISDIAFIYEGQTVLQGDLVKTFQGNYAYKRNGDTFLELYTDFVDDSKPDIYRIATMKDGFVSDSSRTLDEPELRQPTKTRGTRGSMGGGQSPETFLYFWFIDYVKDPTNMGFEFLGWEDVDSHNCLVVKFNRSRNSKGRHVLKMWVDMSRGGHPLRVEHYRDGRLTFLLKDVKLDRVAAADTKEVFWVPSAGVIEGYQWNDRYDLKNPPFVETFALVSGSVRLNSSLSDRLFDISTFDTQSSYRRGFRQLKDLTSQSGEGHRFRTDSQGIEERLVQRLREADEQSKMIQAGSVMRNSWNWGMIIQALLAFAGIGALVFAFRSRHRLQ